MQRVCHLFSRRHHSHNRRVQNVSFIKPEYFLCYCVDCLSLNTNQCSFWKLVDDVIVFYHNAHKVLVESRAYIRSELLTQWNAGCKTLNNDHYQYTYYERLSAFHVLLIYDWLYQISISFSHFFQRQFSHTAWRNFYMN